MGSYNRHFNDSSVNERKHQNRWRARNYQYEPCNANYPVMGLTPYAFPTGATGTFGRWCVPGGDVLMHYKGAGQSILGPALDATTGKMSIALDQTSTEGVEYIFNSIQLSSLTVFPRQNRIAGVSGASFGRVSLTLEDVSGLSECAFGLRKVEAAQANIDDYDEMAVLNVQNGVINRETILNNGATVTTATGQTWADGATKELSWRLGRADAGGGRVCELFVDAIACGRFTFDNNEVLQPFLFLLQAADLSQVYINYFELGFLADVERGV